MYKKAVTAAAAVLLLLIFAAPPYSAAAGSAAAEAAVTPAAVPSPPAASSPAIAAASDTTGSQLPYYLEENITRYVAYRRSNPGMPIDRVVALVNANVDRGFYNDIEIVANPTDICLLLNKNFALPMDYAPPDLVTMGDGKQLRAEAAAAFTRMRIAAGNERLTLVVRSAYRDYWSQRVTHADFLSRFSRESAERQSARPRHSEHELGLAVDVLQRYVSGALGTASFEYSREYAWLLEHGHEYGFILRYPRDTRDIHGYIYEPWHWRYIGVEAATVMYYERISTFEEYYGRYLAPGVIAKRERDRLLQPTPVEIEAGGGSFTAQAYVFDGNNYFRIRDLAFILNCAGMQFDLGFRDEGNALTITCGRPYSTTGDELSGDADLVEPVEPRELTIYVDGARLVITTYQLNGFNYVKLRDMAAALGFTAIWDHIRQVIVIGT